MPIYFQNIIFQNNEGDYIIFDREQRSKVLKEALLFLLLLLFLAWNQVRKMIQMEQKLCKGRKKCASVAHYGIQLPCLPCMALYSLAWPYVALYDLDVTFHGHDYVWPH